jgi:hypothetical protein
VRAGLHSAVAVSALCCLVGVAHETKVAVARAGDLKAAAVNDDDDGAVGSAAEGALEEASPTRTIAPGASYRDSGRCAIGPV